MSGTVRGDTWAFKTTAAALSARDPKIQYLRCVLISAAELSFSLSRSGAALVWKTADVSTPLIMFY